MSHHFQGKTRKDFYKTKIIDPGIIIIQYKKEKDKENIVLPIKKIHSFFSLLIHMLNIKRAKYMPASLQLHMSLHNPSPRNKRK
jgi:hypothetical protein